MVAVAEAITVADVDVAVALIGGVRSAATTTSRVHVTEASRSKSAVTWTVTCCC